MQVVKRNGQREPIDTNKIIQRLKNLCLSSSEPLSVDYERVALDTIRGLKDGVHTSELDTLAASIAQPRSFENPQYGILASRILVSNYHKSTFAFLQNHFKLTKDQLEGKLFYYTMRALFDNKAPNEQHSPIVDPYFFSFVEKYATELESIIDYTRDYQYDFLGFEYLKKSYLLKLRLSGKTLVPIESPQHLILRVALSMVIGKPYQDWNLLRYNHAEIRKQLQSLICNNPRYSHLIAEIKDNIQWNEICNLLDFNLRNQLKEIIEKNVTSWSDYQKTIHVEPLSEKQWMEVRETYDVCSRLLMTHATPTLFNSGTLKPQLSSCYLLALGEDSMKYITKLWTDVSEISKWAGGIGSHLHNLRAKGSYIRGTNGYCDGSVPMYRVLDAVSAYVNQGGKRDGVHAVYISMWHSDIFEIVRLKRPIGNEMERAKYLFYALWINDEFMRTLKREIQLESEGQDVKLWYLMCPDISGNLAEYYDNVFTDEWMTDDFVYSNKEKYAFTYQYRKMIQDGKYVKRVSARELWREVCETIITTSIPYICFSDHVNRKSNQSNLGTIKSSNLCSEIMEYSSATETAVCNLASIALNKMITNQKPKDADQYPFNEGFNGLWFDFTLLSKITKICVNNLDKIIEINFYPTIETRRSNLLHRPMGIGVQGLADLFSILNIPFDSETALKLNFYIFEMMSYSALEKSLDLAREKGHYPTFKGSPLSQGLFQHDLWITEQGEKALKYPLTRDWSTLRSSIIKDGVRNSLLLALMPTGSTSNILGNSPCFEPHNSLVYKRANKLGETIVTNKNLVQDLIKIGLWTERTRNDLMRDSKGSIQNLTYIPKSIRDNYKTAWDMSPKVLINLALTRGVFICQSQSLSLFEAKPTPSLLTKMHFYSWCNGAKTSSYYMRRLAATDAQKIQVQDKQESEKKEIKDSSEVVCYIREDGSKSCCDS
jgi:ribonucleoside-diphosphate reductase alpha chain